MKENAATPHLACRHVINAPAEVVFDLLTDFSRHAESGRDVGRGQSLHLVEPLETGALAIGSRFRSTQRRFGRSAQANLTVTEFDRPSKFAFDAVEEGGYVREFRHRFTIESTPSGCLLTRTVMLRPSPPRPLRWLMRKLVAEPAMEAFHQRLAGAAEASAS